MSSASLRTEFFELGWNVQAELFVVLQLGVAEPPRVAWNFLAKLFFHK